MNTQMAKLSAVFGFSFWFLALDSAAQTELPREPRPVPPAGTEAAKPLPDAPPRTPPNEEVRIQALEEQNAKLQARMNQLDAQRAGTDRDEKAEEPPLAGYSEKNVFVRDRKDNFVLVPKGRVNVDYYHYLNRGDLPAGATDNGPKDSRPKNSLFIKRARVGLAGTVAKIFDFRIEGDFASQPTPPGQYASLADASVVLNASSYLKLEIGQFYAPFTLENMTSENYVDFLEKSAAVRFAVPTSREAGAMLFGELPSKAVRYWLGVFDGEGQNVKNLDNNPALIGRAIVSPLAFAGGHPQWVENLWAGGSFWVERNTNLGGQAAPSTTGATQGDLAPFATQGSWSVFSSSYNNGVTSVGGPAVRSHLTPNSGITKYAFELNVPIGERWGLRGEYVHQTMGVKQYNDVNNAGSITRTEGAEGKLTGSGGYLEAYVWLGQSLNVDKPGLYQVPHWKGYQSPPDPSWAVMLAAKYEHVGFDVQNLPQTISATTGTAANDAALGHYALDVLELGGSLWYTRHARFMMNYVANHIGDGGASSALRSNLFYDEWEHELLLRWAASL